MPASELLRPGAILVGTQEENMKKLLAWFKKKRATRLEKMMWAQVIRR